MRVFILENNGEISVKYENKDYILQKGESVNDITKLCKPKVQYVINDWIVTETATTEEIQAHQKEQKYQEAVAFQAKKKADGIAYADKINTELVIIMDGKTPAQIEKLDMEYKSKILNYLDEVASGNWWSARRLTSNASLPKLQEIKTLFLKVRSDIRKYVTENYK